MSEPPPVLRAAGLGVAVGEPPRERLVSFELRRGEALQVEGPSGCGKSTLLRVLCRLEAARGGTLALEGQTADELPPRRWRRRLAYLAQQPVMLPGSVADNLSAPFAVDDHRRSSRYDADRAAELLEAVGLDPRPLLERDARVLSGGEAARVALCRALLLEPRALLCDELTAALDDSRATAVVDRVGRYLADGGALVVVAHDHARWARVAGAAPLRQLRLEDRR